MRRRYHECSRWTTHVFSRIHSEMARNQPESGTLKTAVEVLTVRIPKGLIAQLDKLTERLRKRPEYVAFDVEITRAQVLRVVIRKGIEAIERDLAKKK